MGEVYSQDLQKGDEFRGNGPQGFIYQFRNGCNLGLIASSMWLIQNYQGFLSFARSRAKAAGFFRVRPLKDPWILRVE